MAGLKKTGKDKSSPNLAVVVFLIFFILVSIGLGVFAYYGYDSIEKSKQDATRARKDLDSMKASRDAQTLLAREALLALGFPPPTPEDITTFTETKAAYIQQPDKFQEIKPQMDTLIADNVANLGAFNDAEKKYPTIYKTEWKKSVDDAKKARIQSEELKREYDEFKKNYEVLNAKHEKDVQEMLEKIAQGNQAALKLASKTNDQFPKLETALDQRNKDIKDLNDKLTKEIEDRDGRIARLNIQVADLEKKLNDRSLGREAVAAGAATDVHALMLDISRGIPLWDKPLGKVLRVDPGNLLVYIDMGSKQGIHPELTFNVFAANAAGQADKQLKGTLEVLRVVNESSSLCRITSLYNAEGESIPLVGEGAKIRAIRESDSILKEGDLLFHPFFGMHVAIAGNVNFSGYGADSPATQKLQLEEFMRMLAKNNIIVDAYINVLNGQIERTITPKTRLLIRGSFNVTNQSLPEDQARIKQMVEGYQVLRKAAVDQGMFIISAENFASVIGIHPPSTSGVASEFRPILPWTGGQPVRRSDPALDGVAVGGAAPMPMPEMKKEEK